MNLIKKLDLIIAEAPAAAGTTDLTSAWIDTAGYEGVLFIYALGTITSGAVTVLKAQQAAASDGTGAADLEGTSVTIADTDDNKLFYIDVYRPRERYVAAVLDRGTQNAVLDYGLAIRYGAKKLPVSQSSTYVAGGETHASPAEGTA